MRRGPVASFQNWFEPAPKVYSMQSRRELLKMLVAGGLVLGPNGKSLAQAAEPGEVYLLRGFADVFSRGLDEMGSQLRARGVDARVQGHLGWRGVARAIIANTKSQGREPVILVGHSLGANAVISIAERLADQGIPVDYMAIFAATDPDPVPANVRRVVNYYFETNGWGEPLRPGPGFRGSLVNKDFSRSATVGHFNIDKQRPLQAEVVGEILRTLASA